MKFAHLSDTHIKLHKSHKEYRIIFDQIYSILKEENVDCIVHCGDIFHNKTELSPEAINLSSEFLKSLADIAPTYIIAGNHDANLKNNNRMDSISPIVDILQHKSLTYLKYSCEHVLNEDITFNVLSRFDEEHWAKPTNKDKINIALYHGSIHGSKTDMGFTLTECDHSIPIFEGCDFAMLGDVHLSNQALDSARRFVYPGSTIQQNHAETNDKGFLIWDIKGKDDFNVKHIQVPNPHPFITIELTEEGKLPEFMTIPNNSRLRLVSNYNLPPELMKKAADVAKSKFKPETISFLSKNVNKAQELNASIIGRKEDLRNKAVQNKLISDYLLDYKVSDTMLQQVFDINSRYNTIVESTEEVCRNVNWKLKKVSWDNLFNYGEGNSINFENLNGIVGIFSKNFSGKTSIIDSVLYSIFNTTSKNERKTTNIINQNKSYGRGCAVIEVDGQDYTIDRRAEKYTKKLKGETTEEAKTELDLSRFDSASKQQETLNELSRTDTDKKIRKMFGTIDDFLLTSLSSQLESMSFIKEGSTKRKEVLARFLDLDIFEAKFKLAKEESASLKGFLKKVESRDYDLEISNSSVLLLDLEQSLMQCDSSLKQIQDKITEVKREIENVETQIKESGIEYVNIPILLGSRTGLLTYIESVKKQIDEKKKVFIEKNELFSKLDTFINSFDLTELKSKKDFVLSKQIELKEIYSQVQSDVGTVKRLKDKIKLLNDVPCGSLFPACKFIKDAHKAKHDIGASENDHLIHSNEYDSVSKEIEQYDLTQINSQLSKYEQIVIKKNESEKELLRLEIDMEKHNKDIDKAKSELNNVEDEIEKYKKNNEIFSKIEELRDSEIDKRGVLSLLNSSHAKMSNTIKDTYISIGSEKQKILIIEKDKKELENCRDQFAAYDYFMRCMHPSGISYNIIKNKLPVINAEITRVLSNIVEFEVYFEDDGTKLNVFIKHPKYNPRPIEMGSGAEKTIASMAIRLALLQVSNLPTSNIFILDEPGTALDSENMEGFVRIIEMIKNYYDIVLLISHMDSLKDVADTILTIDKKDGYAYVTF